MQFNVIQLRHVLHCCNIMKKNCIYNINNNDEVHCQMINLNKLLNHNNHIQTQQHCCHNFIIIQHNVFNLHFDN